MNRPVVLALFTISMLAACGHAAVLDGFVSVTGPGLSSYTANNSSINSWAPGNDDTETNGWSSNYFNYVLYFSDAAHVQIVFQVTSPTGDQDVSEYDVVLAPHVNEGAAPWTQLGFELGFLNGGTFVEAGGTGLDFDTPDPGSFVTASHLSVVSRQATSLLLGNGETTPGDLEKVSFSIDLPGRDAVPAYAQTAGGYQFVLRITPTASSAIPEPAMASLLGLLTWFAHRSR